MPAPKQKVMGFASLYPSYADMTSFGGNTPAFPAQWLLGLLRAFADERLSYEDCVLIGKLAINPNKQELLARPARHPEALALEVERAIAESISKHQDRRPPWEMPMACAIALAQR